MRWTAFALSLLVVPALVAGAEQPLPTLEQVEAPPPPAAVESGEPLEPEVTIIQGERETIQEYRVNGQLYMIKVVPKKGYPYYLVDTNGDGRLETRYTDPGAHLLVPHWVLFRWK
jgi:hypothetical protein